MSLFSNQNFINQIAKEMGVPNLDEEVAAVLQTLVETQTRKFIEQASKFARNDCRDQIAFEDLQNALVDLRHSDLVLVEQEENYVKDGSFYIRRDPVHKSAKAFIEEELKVLSLNSFSLPKLRGRWVYIDGRIPRTNENALLKCKSEIVSIRQKEKGQKNKQFNIIMDQPEAMLTGYELQYFKQVTGMLSEGTQDIGKMERIDITGNLSNLLPLFLKFFISTTINDIKMSFFLEMLSNRYIQRSAQFHLHQIMTCLWAYEGKLCLKVGFRIGKYIQRFQDKYKILMQNWWQQDEHEINLNIQARNTAYSNIIKKIGIEIINGNPFSISDNLLKKMDEDINNKNQFAILCNEVIRQYAPVINCLQDKVNSFWLPNPSTVQDKCYMMMNL